MFPEMLNGKKSYIAGLLMIAVGLAEMFGIDVMPGVDASNAGPMIALGFSTVFLKHGQQTGA